MSERKPCRIEACTKLRMKKSALCAMHAARWAKYKSYELPVKPPKSITCRVEGCLKSRGKTSTLCSTHLDRWTKHKDFNPIPKHFRQPDILPNGVARICKIHGELNKDEVYFFKPGRTWCKKCYNKRVGDHCKKQRKQDKVKTHLRDKRGNLKAKFGITLEQYQEMQTNQNNACAICLQPETRFFKGAIASLAIDHCHNTGKIRGLLCANCNFILGHAKDSTTTLLAAINYLNQ